MSGTHQLSVEIRSRVAFALRSREYVLNCRRRKWRLTAVHLDSRRDLAVKQGQSNVPGGVMLLTKCESTDTASTDAASAPAARRLDHLIATSLPAKPRADHPRTRKVQHPKCCGRCSQLSSNTESCESVHAARNL